MNCANLKHFKNELSTSDFYLPEDGDSYVIASIQISCPSTIASMIVFPQNDDDIFSITTRECDNEIVVQSR